MLGKNLWRRARSTYERGSLLHGRTLARLTRPFCFSNESHRQNLVSHLLAGSVVLHRAELARLRWVTFCAMHDPLTGSYARGRHAVALLCVRLVVSGLHVSEKSREGAAVKGTSLSLLR